MSVDPRLLRSFVVLAEELHYGRAAQRLNLAQPGLSLQIQRLERQVGSPLFRRSSRAVEVTATGRAMIEPARAAVAAIDHAERAAKESAAATPLAVRVGVNFCLEDAIDVLASYEAARPEVILWTSRMFEGQGHDGVATGQLDAFVGFLPPGPRDAVSRVPTIDVPLLALIRSDDPVAHGRPLTLRAFRRSPIVLPARHQTPQIFDYFVDVLSEGAGRSALTIHELAPSGVAGTPPAERAEHRGNAVRFGEGPSVDPAMRAVPFDPPLTVPAFVSWVAGRSAATDALVDHLRSDTPPAQGA